MNCAEAREELSAALDGALTAEESRAVEAHAAGCAACRAWRAEMADVRGLLRGIDDADEPPGLSATVGREVLAAIQRGPVRGADADRKRAARSDASRRLVFAVVASIVAVVLAGFLLVPIGLAWVVSSMKPRTPATSPSVPSSSRSRPAPSIHGKLSMSADDASTRDGLRALFAKWPGTFTADQADADQRLFALTVEFEGPASAVGEFEKLLAEFQRAHSGSLRSWRYSSETRD